MLSTRRTGRPRRPRIGDRMRWRRGARGGVRWGARGGEGGVGQGWRAWPAGPRPSQLWRTPLYRSHPIAAAAGIRAAIWLVLPAAFFVLAGWPPTAVSLSLVAVVIALGATTPDPKGFAIVALIATPIASASAGTLEFLVLDGANEFTLLALA